MSVADRADPRRAHQGRRPHIAAPTIALAITAGIFIGILASSVMLLDEIRNQWGEDYRFFMSATRRWLETGEFYLLHQTAGPYEARSAVDVLYPPVVLWLFVPFTVLPAALWWVIPIGIVTWHVWNSRPVWWTWPVIAALCWVPRDQSIVILGNTGIWIAAFVALGLRSPAASPFVLLKPTFAPLALIGFRSRAWWVGLCMVAAVSMSVLPLWFDYVRAIQNNVGTWPPGFAYSLPDYLLCGVPIIAWVGRTRPARTHFAVPSGAS